MRAGEKFEIIKSKHGFVIGGFKDAIYMDYELQLEPGDKLFLYTDGLPEATNGDNEMLGIDGMLDALNENCDSHPEVILNGVKNAVDGFVKEAEQFDDLTMMCIEYKGGCESEE